MPSVTGGAEHAAAVVAPPVVLAVRRGEQVPAAAAVVRDANAPPSRVTLGLPSEQGGQERWEIDRQARLPVGTAVGVVLRRDPVELTADLADLPFDPDLARVHVAVLQADDLAPPQPGVGECEDQREVVVPAGQQGGPFGEK
jgi:hypothetical protein